MPSLIHRKSKWGTFILMLLILFITIKVVSNLLPSKPNPNLNEIPKTAKPVGESDLYFKDINGVYTRIASDNIGNDSMTFGGSFAEFVNNADPKTFNIINEYYGKDLSGVFYVEKLTNIDVATVSDVYEFYVKDSNAVYYKGNLIESADPNSFEVIKVPLDLYKQKLYTTELSKDKNSIFHNGVKVANADVNTFTVIPRERKIDDPEGISYFSQDKVNVWRVSDHQIVLVPDAN